MANQPNRHSIRRAWLVALIGTPERAFWTVIVFACVISLLAIFREQVGATVTALIITGWALIQQVIFALIPFVLLLIAFKIFWQKVFNPPKRRDGKH